MKFITAGAGILKENGRSYRRPGEKKGNGLAMPDGCTEKDDFLFAALVCASKIVYNVGGRSRL